MLRRGPLKAKREKPRRDEGRVTHERQKPRANTAPTAEERRHFARIVALGCVVCGGAATVHHCTSDGYKRIARSHQRVLPLCPQHHQIQFGPRESIEALGHAGFARVYDINPLERAYRLWKESNGS